MQRDPVTGNYLCGGGGWIPEMTKEQRALADTEHGAASVAGSLKSAINTDANYVTHRSVLFPGFLDKLAALGVLRKKRNASDTGDYFTFTNITNAWCNCALSFDSERNRKQSKSPSGQKE